MKKRVISIMLSAAMVLTSVSPMSLVGIQAATDAVVADVNLKQETATNLLLNATVTTSGNEATQFSGAKIVDGIVNRTATNAEQSRWASTASSASELNPKWVQIELSEVKTFQSFVIEWERNNVTNYKIQVSTDGSTWTNAYTTTTQSASEKDTINLAAPVQTKFIKLVINSFLANSPMPNGTAMNWNTVSVFEMQGFATAADVPVVPVETLDTVVAGLQVPAVVKGDAKMKMPTVPEGYTIEFIGADYEQIVDRDLTIYQPLVDKEVEVNFRVKKGTEVKESAGIEVMIPGKQATATTGNAKPNVVPALTEWVGGTGDFTLTNNSRIVIDPAAGTNLDDMAAIFKTDYKDITGKDITIVKASQPAAGDYFFTLNTTDEGLGKEGYLMTIGDFVKVEAKEATGAFWSTRSILQILKQNETTIPKGTTRDYPKFEKRGFMLDVGRKFYTLDYVYDIMKNMSWYKMNDFQLHLNDNYIWIEEYKNIEGKNEYDAYSGFRLESSVTGKNGEQLHNEDGYYTKDEFRTLIQTSRDYGVQIVPEIDVPAHALSFTKIRPDLAMTDTSVARAKDHMDLSNPETLPFIKSIFNEYMDGENPVFDKDTIVHIGTDEYSSKYASAFRTFTNDMLTFIKSKDRVPRLWGGLTRIPGNPEVRGEGSEINIWSKDWAEPTQMYNLGFKMINILDSTPAYIVPNGTGNSGAYADTLPVQQLYQNLIPNRITGKVFPAGSEQMLGAAFAVWHDNIDRKETGLTQYDIVKVINQTIPVYAEKNWAVGERPYSEFKKIVDVVDLAPDTNLLFEVESKDKKVLEYKFEEDAVADTSGNAYNSVTRKNATSVEGKVGKGIQLTGNDSYISTPLTSMGPSYSIEMWVKKEAGGNGEQILLESALGTVKANIANSGKMGFTRENRDYTFDYSLPEGVWTQIRIDGKPKATTLFVNGAQVASATNPQTSIRYFTLLLPLTKIGSETNQGFKGVVDEVVVLNTSTPKERLGKNLLDKTHITPTCDNQNGLASEGKEGPITLAFDNDEITRWHSNYSPKKDLPATVTMTLDNVYKLNKLFYLPRQDGSANGQISSYEIQVSKDGTNFTSVATGTWSEDANLKGASFEAQDVKVLKFIAKAGKGGFASAGEFYLQQGEETSGEPEVIEVASVALNKNSTSLEVGKTEVITATVSPENATVKTVTWTSADATIASVANGTITALKAGTTTISASTANGKSATISVTVTPTTTITVDKTQLLNKIAEVERLEEATYTPATWSVLKTALEAAKTVANNAAATLEQVTKALSDLTAGVNQLKEAGLSEEKALLKNKINQAKQVDASKYTPESYAALQKLLSEAETLFADANAEQKALDEKAAELEEAIKALDPVQADGWKEVDGKQCYYVGGVPKANTWVPEGTEKRYAGKDGFRAEGWKKIGTTWYFFDKTTGYMKTGWLKDAGAWYYLMTDGKMKTGWLKDKGVWYYLLGSGKMATGWVKTGGAWYYLLGSGKMATGWAKVGGVWYYLQSSGKMKTGWLKDNGVWYFLQSSGKMKTGWLKDNGAWYYLQSSGKMKTGWIKDAGAWYYLQSSGKMKTGWLQLGASWYYLHSNGKMATGWVQVGAVKYYMAPGTGIWTGEKS